MELLVLQTLLEFLVTQLIGCFKDFCPSDHLIPHMIPRDALVLLDKDIRRVVVVFLVSDVVRHREQAVVVQENLDQGPFVEMELFDIRKKDVLVIGLQQVLLNG